MCEACHSSFRLERHEHPKCEWDIHSSQFIQQFTIVTNQYQSLGSNIRKLQLMCGIYRYVRYQDKRTIQFRGYSIVVAGLESQMRLSKKCWYSSATVADEISPRQKQQLPSGKSLTSPRTSTVREGTSFSTSYLCHQPCHPQDPTDEESWIDLGWRVSRAEEAARRITQ